MTATPSGLPGPSGPSGSPSAIDALASGIGAGASALAIPGGWGNGVFSLGFATPATILAVSFTVVTDATVGNRTPQVYLLDTVAERCYGVGAVDSATHSASTTQSYLFTPLVPALAWTLPDGVYLAGPLVGVHLPPNSQLRIQLLGGQAGDRVDNITILASPGWL